ncbi:hypothetical protein E4S40_09630 [Algoriphagus kandeliae]|uniref:DUF4136 domain-containing protein n=1 Tax=Algoriphagus kandeliae TaxID=2562278 RepID=A0A4Y9QSZ0_9BACT|nr:hypothetical protein [Algoriphagus kandeliae]TFV94286.1 hypothetical protein E4S40_09630 [Algoriphagus kandeliae]
MKKSNFILLLSLVAVMISCSPSVKILGSWTSPSKPAEGYSSVFVTALTENLLARQAVEKDLVDLIQSKGITASSSFEVIPPGFKAKESDKETILAKIKEMGSESILTIALLDQTNETRYVPGTTMYTPMRYGYYGRFWGYYNYYNPVMYDPGYYTTDKNYYLEANLYDVATEELVWSSQSETTNPSSLETFSKTFAESIVKQLIKDGFISE